MDMNKKKLLIISSIPTHPTYAGNRSRLYSLLEFYEMKNLDFHIVFFDYQTEYQLEMIQRWGEQRCSFIEYTYPPRRYNFLAKFWQGVFHLAGQHYNIPYRIDDLITDDLIKKIIAIAEREQPSSVQIEYVFYSKLFSCFNSSVYKILDTHDLFSNRHHLFQQLGKVPSWLYTTKRQEAIGFKRADCIIAIQDSECASFKKLTNKKVMCVGHFLASSLSDCPSNKLPTVVFIGSNNCANQDAVEFLQNEIWPRILKVIPNAELEIYGGVCERITLKFRNIQLKGIVNDVSEAYLRAWVIVNPIRFGTGLKIKMIEALSKGKAVVSTETGCAGIEDGKHAFLYSDSAEEFSQHCLRILSDDSLRRQLEKLAYEYIIKWNKVQQNSLEKVLATAGLL